MPDVPEGSEDVLRREILADAERKARRAVTKGRRQAEKIVEKANKDAERALSLARKQIEKRAARERASAESTLSAEMRRLELVAKDDLINEVFDRVLRELASETDAERKTIVERLATRGLAAMNGSRFSMVVAPQDEKLIDDDLLARISRKARRSASIVVESSSGIQGGAAMLSSDGRQQYDNSWEARIERLSSTLRLKVAEILFAESDAE